MRRYITITSQEPLRVKRSTKRPSLSDIKGVNEETLRTDYEAKVGVKINKPKEQGLSRNHRISDANIQENIVEDINSDFENDLVSNLIEAFPWSSDGREKARAKNLLKSIKENKQVEDRLNAANTLIELMSLHITNLSYGNSSQNSAIGKALDLNAPLNKDNKHSLTPRSRKLCENLAGNKSILFTPPKMKDSTTIRSSQYGKGAKNHKEEKNINIPLSTSRTKKLLNTVTLKDYKDAFTFFRNLYKHDGLDLIKKVRDGRLVFLHEKFGAFLSDFKIPVEEFFSISFKKMQCIANEDFLDLMLNGHCDFDDLTALSIKRLERINEHSGEICELISNGHLSLKQINELPYSEFELLLELIANDDFLGLILEEECDFDDLRGLPPKLLEQFWEASYEIHEIVSKGLASFKQICELTPKEFEVFIESDLEKAINENAYAFEDLIKLYREDPLHLTCLTSDLYDLLLERGPDDIPQIMINYAKEFDIDLEDIASEWGESDRLLMSWNHGTTFR